MTKAVAEGTPIYGVTTGFHNLVGHAIAVHLLMSAQACELRGGLASRPAIQSFVAAIRKLSPGLEDDRPLDGDIETVYQTLVQTLVAGPLGQCLEGRG